MKSLDSLVKKAMEYRDKGLTEKEIGAELHLSSSTVNWLLTRGVKGEPPKDIKVGWRSVGVYGSRIGYISAALSDIIVEEMIKNNSDFDTVLGISINGIPYATFVSDELEKELAVYRPAEMREKGGAFSSNYADVRGKKVVIVDDVISTGETLKVAIESLRENSAKAVLISVLVNKTALDSLEGVPLRALFRARAI